MSKNVVDAGLQHNQQNALKIGFIPSRRQVEYSGGYVNNWTTKSFFKYVNNGALIERDHGGPHQGLHKDDGLKSFEEDSKYMDIIHIDPWKKYLSIDQGSRATVESLQRLHKANPNLTFEIGTEESIRKFSTSELEQFLSYVQNNTSESCYKKIVFCVIQSGVGLDLANMKNTGKYSEKRLIEMIKISQKFGLKTKEHNGDYLNKNQIKERFQLGLDAINIAPEFGQIETKCYYENMSQRDRKTFYEICYNSKRWEKWVDTNFDPIKNTKDLILICGHYNFSDIKFQSMKPPIQKIIQQRIRDRIEEVLGEV